MNDLHQAWSKAVNRARKKKPKKSSGAGEAPTAAAAAATPVLQQQEVQQSLQQLDHTQSVLAALLAAVTQAARQLASAGADVEAAAAPLLATYDASSNALIQELVGWENRVSVQVVLKDSVSAQQKVLRQLVETAKRLSSRLTGLAW